RRRHTRFSRDWSSDVCSSDLYRLKRKLLGKPMHSEQLEHERLGKPTALAVFASDNLSSSAYATEEILHVLVPAIGIAAFSLVMRSEERRVGKECRSRWG